MSSELVTAVEVGRSLYIYKGDTLITSIIVQHSDLAESVAVFRSNSPEFRHIQISHTDWDTLLDWEDRVAKSSLSMLLESAWARQLTVTHLPNSEV